MTVLPLNAELLDNASEGVVMLWMIGSNTEPAVDENVPTWKVDHGVYLFRPQGVSDPDGMA